MLYLFDITNTSSHNLTLRTSIGWNLASNYCYLGATYIQYKLTLCITLLKVCNNVLLVQASYHWGRHVVWSHSKYSPWKLPCFVSPDHCLGKRTQVPVLPTQGYQSHDMRSAGYLQWTIHSHISITEYWEFPLLVTKWTKMHDSEPRIGFILLNTKTFSPKVSDMYDFDNAN